MKTPLKISKLQDFTKGWFIGNFSPTLMKTEQFEVAVKKYEAGEKESSHYHKIATEYTLIVSGIAKMNGEHISENDIVTVMPDEEIEFEAVTDVVTVVIKTPSVTGDKFSN
jgi:mannose-6-phosphate isomerase-like protein (cupin superfamily)